MANITAPIMLDSTGQDIADAISTIGATSVGNLNALTTTDKSSLVGAVNEVKSGLTNLNTALLARVQFHNTLANDVLASAKNIDNDTVHFWNNSNKPANRPTNCDWGAYIMYRVQDSTTIIYMDTTHFACTYGVESTSASITWHEI